MLRFSRVRLVSGEPRAAGVVTFGCGEDAHEDHTHIALTRRVASLLRQEFLGPLEGWSGDARPYCVPQRTLSGDCPPPQLHGLAESEFLGGWVPHAMLGSKAIVHPLAPNEHPPPGWPTRFASAARAATLDGFTALTRAGALHAASILLAHGPIRVKAAYASGGNDQHIVRTHGQLADFLDLFDGDDTGRLCEPVVVEENLDDVTTFSVGRIRVGATIASYVGVQQLTRNNRMQTVYGGSQLFVVRGEGEALTPLLTAEEAEVCRTATQFDALAGRHLGVIASRRNYDVACGIDARGRRRVAVLEQSWRVGGATGAELAALEAFERDPRLRHVRAATVERYGSAVVPPADAVVYYHGVDRKVGPLLKYAVLQDRM